MKTLLLAASIALTASSAFAADWTYSFNKDPLTDVEKHDMMAINDRDNVLDMRCTSIDKEPSLNWANGGIGHIADNLYDIKVRIDGGDIQTVKAFGTSTSGYVIFIIDISLIDGFHDAEQIDLQAKTDYKTFTQVYDFSKGAILSAYGELTEACDGN